MGILIIGFVAYMAVAGGCRLGRSIREKWDRRHQ